VVIVAQRVSTIMQAERIIVLETAHRGLGTHQELVKSARPTGDRGLHTGEGQRSEYGRAMAECVAAPNASAQQGLARYHAPALRSTEPSESNSRSRSFSGHVGRIHGVCPRFSVGTNVLFNASWASARAGTTKGASQYTFTRARGNQIATMISGMKITLAWA